MHFDFIILFSLLVLSSALLCGSWREKGQHKNILNTFTVLTIFSFLVYISALVIVMIDPSKYLAKTISEVAIYSMVLVGTPAVTLIFLFIGFKFYSDKKRTLDWFSGKI